MKRNLSMDFIKGIAIFFVVIGHALQFSIDQFETEIFFNIIWALQIPLFMMVSGYFSGRKFRKNELGFMILNNAKSYLLPFFSFFYIVKIGILQNSRLIQGTKELFWKLENSLWFLWILFFFQVFANVAMFFTKKKKCHFTKVVTFFGVLLITQLPAIILVVNRMPTFFGAKYLLYYSIYFFGGLLYKIHEPIIKRWISTRMQEYIFGVSALLFFIIICRYNLYLLPDTIFNISVRVLGSVSGCIMIFLVAHRISDENVAKQFVANVLGKNTLEIYFVHMLFCRVFDTIKTKPQLFTLDGTIVILLNLGWVILFSFLIINLVKKSQFLNYVLFGKKYIVPGSCKDDFVAIEEFVKK